MPRKSKELKLSIPAPSGHAAPASTFSDSMRTLINGLFGKRKPYQPSRDRSPIFISHPVNAKSPISPRSGFPVHEIADALGMNFQTVRIHLRHILTKMELNDPRELRE